MSIKLFHTADVHIGMQFASNLYSEDVRAGLIEARFITLQRMVAEANKRQCDLFVIAGDLFDSLKVSVKSITRTAEIISAFTGEFVFVLPGNHDFIDSDENNLWSRFQKAAKPHVIVFEQESPMNFEIGQTKLTVYPGPCRSKHSAENAIGWIANTTRNDATLNIGIAHGAVQGLSPDNDDKYFLMTENELAACNMDMWLLGHTHIFAPKNTGLMKPLYFMPATPEPDGFDCKHEGFAWYIEADDQKKISYEQIKTGMHRFFDVDVTISSEADLDALLKRYEGMPANNALLRLELSGRLPQDVLSKLPDLESQLKGLFYFADVRSGSIKLDIDKSFIEANYSPGSLPWMLLTNVLDKSNDPGAVNLAYELIEGAKQ